MGYLEGGFRAYKEANLPFETADVMKTEDFRDLHHKDKTLNIIDVRNFAEMSNGRVAGSFLIPLDRLENEIK